MRRQGFGFLRGINRQAEQNSDWYQLLDLCALTDTLIADADGVYHPASSRSRYQSAFCSACRFMPRRRPKPWPRMEGAGVEAE